jgi:arginine/lysine/ornithine decarboxylase
MVTYLDAYRLNQYSMYGAVPLREIKSQLLALRRAGKLDRVKMLLLTNCTSTGSSTTSSGSCRSAWPSSPT